MRLPGPMTRGEFRDALQYALDGRFVTGNGANQETQDALDAISMALPHPPGSLIAAAHAAYRKQRVAEK